MAYEWRLWRRDAGRPWASQPRPASSPTRTGALRTAPSLYTPSLSLIMRTPHVPSSSVYAQPRVQPHAQPHAQPQAHCHASEPGPSLSVSPHHKLAAPVWPFSRPGRRPRHPRRPRRAAAASAAGWEPAGTRDTDGRSCARVEPAGTRDADGRSCARVEPAGTRDTDGRSCARVEPAGTRDTDGRTFRRPIAGLRSIPKARSPRDKGPAAAIRGALAVPAIRINGRRDPGRVGSYPGQYGVSAINSHYGYRQGRRVQARGVR